MKSLIRRSILALSLLLASNTTLALGCIEIARESILGMELVEYICDYVPVGCLLLVQEEDGEFRCIRVENN